MSIWSYIAIALCLTIILRSIINLYNLCSSLKWLHTKPAAKSAGEIQFIVCIPALNEQSTIVETIKTFLEQSYPIDRISIYIVTSAKEASSLGLPTTREVVDQYIASLDKSSRRRVHLLHYTNSDGYMAHQVNYVADRVQNKLKKPGTYFVIYNADSHIDQDTFKVVDSIIANKATRDSNQPTLLQQSAVYQYTGKSSIAEGAGLHQTLWTLVHEIPRLRKQSSKVQHLRETRFVKSIKNSRIAHCVGHGLFVRGDYYLNHPLPQDILNEDLPYGLLACALREPIYPIPSLEIASTPSKTINVYHQKATWFNPFFEFVNYGKSIIRQKLYVSKFEVWWLLVQAYASLMIWLVHSIILVGSFIVSIIAGWLYVICWTIAFLFYWIVPALIVTKQRGTIKEGGSNSYSSILGGIPYVLTHSVGPFISTYRWFIASIHGTKPSKRKTEST